MAVKIGTASYGNQNFQKKNYFKLEKGENVFRILPPLFELAEKGRWSVYYKVEFGYKNSDGRLCPFQCPRVVNNKTKMVEVESAAHVRRENLKAKLKDMKDSGASQNDLEKMKSIVEQYNLDSKHYMNVIDLSGKIGLLKIGYTAKQALDAEIESLKKQGVDPLSVENGRFFVFNKSGFGLDTLYTVRVYKEIIVHPELGRIERDAVHALNDDIISRLDKEAFKLDSLYPKLMADQVERIVNEGATACDEIFSKKEETKTESVAKTEKTVPVSTSTVTVQETQTRTVEMPQTATTPQTEEEFLKSIGAM